MTRNTDIWSVPNAEENAMSDQNEDRLTTAVQLLKEAQKELLVITPTGLGDRLLLHSLWARIQVFLEPELETMYQAAIQEDTSSLEREIEKLRMENSELKVRDSNLTFHTRNVMTLNETLAKENKRMGDCLIKAGLEAFMRTDKTPEEVADHLNEVINSYTELEPINQELSRELESLELTTETAQDILCMALGKNHGRGGLIAHAQKAARQLEMLKLKPELEFSGQRDLEGWPVLCVSVKNTLSNYSTNFRFKRDCPKEFMNAIDGLQYGLRTLQKR